MAALIPTGPIAHILRAMTSLHRFKEKKAKSFASLTSREKEVLALVAEGVANPEIARKLDISRVTIQNHRANIRAKLNINSQADYYKFAIAYDLIQL